MTLRQANLLGFSSCVALLSYAIYAEKFMNLLPCPLCVFQRVGIAILGFVFLVAALHNPRGRSASLAYAITIPLIALLPAGVAARHVYIQSLPPGSVPACGATLDYMLDVFPPLTVVRKVLAGGGECDKIDWSLLGLSMPAWVLIASLALAVLGIWANSRPRRMFATRVANA